MAHQPSAQARTPRVAQVSAYSVISEKVSLGLPETVGDQIDSVSRIGSAVAFQKFGQSSQSHEFLKIRVSLS